MDGKDFGTLRPACLFDLWLDTNEIEEISSLFHLNGPGDSSRGDIRMIFSSPKTIFNSFTNFDYLTELSSYNEKHPIVILQLLNVHEDFNNFFLGHGNLTLAASLLQR